MRMKINDGRADLDLALFELLLRLRSAHYSVEESVGVFTEHVG